MSTLDDLRAAMDQIEQAKPAMHYIATDQVPIGRFYKIGARGFYPDVWIFHPEDFAQQRVELSRHARLLDFRNWQLPPDQVDREIEAILAELRTGNE
jgi:hypothetical protein